MFHCDPKQIADHYLKDFGGFVIQQLGAGTEGTVFQTSQNNAIKIHSYSHFFENELKVYERLREHQVEKIDGFHVPQLIRFDCDRLIIEMTTVKSPYILDFGKSKVDFKEDFTQDAWNIWHQQNREKFEDDWPRVHRAVKTLERLYGIHHADLNLNNINLGDSRED